MSFDPPADSARILAQAGHGLEAMEQEAFALRYAVLVLERGGRAPLGEVVARLERAAAAMTMPGSPPMALLAAGAFPGEGEAGMAELPDGDRAVLRLVAPGPAPDDAPPPGGLV